MWLLKQLVTLIVVLSVSSSSISTTVTTTTSPTATTPSSLTPTSTQLEGEAEEEPIVPSASVGEVETKAVVVEVDDDWSDSTSDQQEESPDDDLNDPDDADIEEDDYYYNVTEEAPTQEAFEANVPQSLHYDKDIVIHRDNLIPILKTVVQASTHKKNPSYMELLKAGGISAFKTSLKYVGEEKMGLNLLTLAKKLTNVFDDDEEDEDEESKILSEMAEEFLHTHRFKLVLPESILLHEKEMKEFMERQEQSEMLRARAATSESQMTIFMPRQVDPATGVTTLLSEY